MLYAKIDVALARDPRMLACGPLARLLYVQCVLYARENLTDGEIAAVILPYVAVDIHNPRKHMARLVEAGSLVVTVTGWMIPEQVWKRYNPLRQEVDAVRQTEAERKQAYRDRRRNATVVSHPDMSVAHGTPRKQPEPEPEPEPEQEVLTSQNNSSTARTRRPTTKTKPKNGTTDPRIEQAADRYATNAWNTARQTAIANPDAFRAAKHNEAITNPELQRLAHDYPTAPPDVLAAALNGENHSLRYHKRALA